MARTRIVEYAGIDYFARWPERQFWIWLAGYFDGEGCVHLPKPQIGVDVSVSSTNRDVIESIHRYLRLGYIEEVVFDQAGWNTKYTWRVRRYTDARTVLLGMRPFLTIKTAATDAAIVRIAEAVHRANAKRQRHAEIVRLAEQGLLQREIAERVGVNRVTVSIVLKKAGERGLSPDDIENDREPPLFVRDIRRHRQRHQKPVKKVRTTHTRLTAKL